MKFQGKAVNILYRLVFISPFPNSPDFINRILSETIVIVLACYSLQYLQSIILPNSTQMISHMPPHLLDLSSFSQKFSDTSTEADDQLIPQIPHTPNQNQNQLDLKTLHNRKCHIKKIKSSLCKNFTENGHCAYGNRCKFAHGSHELRCNEDKNSCYKTKLCHTFFSKNCCPYGLRCNFIHRETRAIGSEEKWRIIYRNHRDTIRQCKKRGSRMMEILSQQKS